MSRTVDLIEHLEVVESLLKLAAQREQEITVLTRENETLKCDLASVQPMSGPETDLR